jgi:hypothetical protein
MHVVPWPLVIIKIMLLLQMLQTKLSDQWQLLQTLRD